MTAIAFSPISTHRNTGNIYGGDFIYPQYRDVYSIVKLTTPIAISTTASIQKKILGFASLPDDWDGYEGAAPNIQVIIRALSFLDLLPKSLNSLLEDDDVVCTPHGTIVFDITNNDCVLSVEVGERSIGYFMEQNGEYPITVESETFNGINMPLTLRQALGGLI